jgi:hypothetical protein
VHLLPLLGWGKSRRGVPCRTLVEIEFVRVNFRSPNSDVSLVRLCLVMIRDLFF